MQSWKKDFLSFWNNRIYVWMLSLTALFSYGFLLTHHTVGIDDTPYSYYFKEGLNVIVGRWFLYLLNKVFRVGDFAPFLTDLAGVLILMLAVTVWCTLLYRICKESVPMWGYVFFSCIFISCPLISEVYTYYLHNAISVGYLGVGISLCFFKELSDALDDMKEQRGQNWKKAVICGIGAAFFLFVALGCYESFMIVWLVGLIVVLLLKCCHNKSAKVFPALVMGACIAVLAIVLRGMMIAACTAIFDLGYMKDEAVQRSIGEMLGWMFEADAVAKFAMVIKRVYVMYFVFALAYLPIKVFVFAGAFIVIYGIWNGIKKKNAWIGVLTVGMFIASFLLVVIEGKETLYRSAQFLPLVCGIGVLMFAHWVKTVFEGRVLQKVIRVIAVFILCVVLWNQCYDMNNWFYVDWLKYEDARNVMGEVANELEKNFDTSKPVIFTGGYQIPGSIIEDAYVWYNSETYYKMRYLTDLVDKDLLDKYNRGDYGVWVAQTPALSVIDWGMSAFDSNEELIHFMEMHGWKFVPNTDFELYERMNVETANWPAFPAEGSIVDMGEYIVVHF